MKLVRRTALALALATSALAGCSKTSDTGHLEHDANGLVKMFAGKLAHLQERRLVLESRKKSIAGLAQNDAGTLQSDFDAAVRTLDKLRDRTRTAPNELSAFAKGSAARVSLISKTGDLRRELGDGLIVVTSAFDTYELYLDRLERSRNNVAAAPTTEPTPPPAQGSATASPPTPSGDLPASSSTTGN